MRPPRQNQTTLLLTLMSPQYPVLGLHQASLTPTLTTIITPQWTLSGFNLEEVISIAFSPNYTNDRIILVGTGHDIYRSINGGVNWSGVKGSTVPHTYRVLSFSPNYHTDQTIFAGSSNGIYRSLDRGDNWTNLDPPGEYIWSMVVSPNYANDQTIFAGTDSSGSGSGQIFRSVDGGDSWQNIASTSPGFTVRALVISPNYANDQTLFAGLDQSWNWYNGGVHRSTDGGDN